MHTDTNIGVDGIKALGQCFPLLTQLAVLALSGECVIETSCVLSQW